MICCKNIIKILLTYNFPYIFVGKEISVDNVSKSSSRTKSHLEIEYLCVSKIYDTLYGLCLSETLVYNSKLQSPIYQILIFIIKNKK